MASLRIENGPQRGARVALPTNGNFVVGSEPKSAQLVLVDPKVSRLHFTLTIGPGSAVTLKDLGAAEGTLVNGRKVATIALKSGDRIQAGDTTILFDPPAEAPTPTKSVKSSAESAGPNLSGQTIGGYRIEKLVGRGGMGTVYRAVQVSLDRIVALKVLPSQLVADRGFVELFFREARAAGKLNHPNVVQVYDVGEAGGIYFYSMEFMEGGTIEARLQREGKLPLADAIGIVRDAARGLQFAEAQKIVHRDIKPDNLMISMSGHAKIADLGLAAPHESSEPGKGKIFGTPHFISPEQAKGQVVDARSDLYSLGATFFRILTGKTPFAGKDVREILQKQIQQEAPRLRSVDPEIPEEIDAMVAKLLAKDPAQRFQSAKELGEAIEAYLNPKGHSGRKLAMLAGIPVVLMLAALLVWKPWETRDPQIIEKIVERPDDPSKAAEAARMRQELQEKEAHIAFQGVPAGAAAAERLQAFEQVAEKYSATEFGKAAKREAISLRAQIEDRRRAEEAQAARLGDLEKRWRDLATPLLESKRFRDAAIAVAAAPELSVPEILAEDAALAEKIYADIAAAAEKEAGAWLREAENSISESNFAPAEALLAKIRDAIGPLEGLPATLRENFSGHREAAEKALARLAAMRAEKERATFQADATIVYQSLFANRALAQDVSNLRFPAALALLGTTREKMQTSVHREYLDRWKADLEACDRALQSLIAHVQSQDLTEKSVKNPGNGRTQPALAASRGEGIAVPDPAKRDSKIWISWDKFRPAERLFELFHNRWSMKADEAMDTAQLLLCCGLALEAPEFAKAWNGVANRQAAAEKPENGKPSAPQPLLDPKIFAYAKEFLEKAESLGASKERWGSLRERLRAEEEVATNLARAFRYLSERDFDAALRELEATREKNAGTFLFALFTDGSTPFVTRGQ